uniref:winged helix-turn-helix transcriptional regulator n=1 Tax=Sulfolobus sp. NOB8H2 TaxID=84600 RepID=UPI00159EBD2C|nr:winged helix-turn-helix transcriptional regulator [Sulfolobus sp. NOB8H2]
MSKKFETYAEEFFSTHERMLIALCKEDGITVRELINRSKISSSAYRSPLDFLIKIGLVKIEKGGEKKMIVKLTNNGREVCKKLQELYEILKNMKPTVEIYPGLSLPVDELEKLVDKYLIIGGTPPRIMAVANDDYDANEKFGTIFEEAKSEADLPKAIIFLTKEMLKPYL